MVASFRPPHVIAIDPNRPQWRVVRTIAAAIRQGELVVIPTDTVYGLAANPFSSKAVNRIFCVKKRAKNKPIPLLVDSLERVSEIAGKLPADLPKLAAEFWPGALTIIVSVESKVLRRTATETKTLAVRMPATLSTLAIIRASGGVLTGTSANLSGFPSATTAAEAKRQLRDRVYYIVDGGRSLHRQPSTILDLSTGSPRILRRGSIPWQRLAKYLH